MLFSRLVETSATVSATRSRTAKTEAVAALLAGTDPEQPAELEVAVAYLSGALRQRRTGLGWRSLGHPPDPADEPSLTLLEVDTAFAEVSAVSGAGSQARRATLVDALFGRATGAEQLVLRGLATGELRQGALDGVMLEAIAKAFAVPSAAVRRATMLGGASGPVAVAAMTGGVAALEEFRLELMRPLRPMLASSAPDVPGALEKGGDEALVWDCKLDGIRVQVHRDGEDVRVWTRSLDEITDRLPEVVTLVRSLPAERLVLDGEAVALDAGGRPRPFQETASRTATHGADAAALPLSSYFFDVLHLDGADLLDEPLSTRLESLDALVPQTARTRRSVTADAAEAQAFFDGLVADGHEGVVAKRLGTAYDAGRRGAGWIKVKPRHTLDLVVLAVEWGSGRRRGKLSNIHLGARAPDSPTGFVMLGKTFKGMTDEVLDWQTERFLGLETHREGHVVHVRPEQVVEIAIDGLQTSTRYPGGVALRFARVVRYRDDKTAAQADTLTQVRALG